MWILETQLKHVRYEAFLGVIMGLDVTWINP